LIAIGYTIGAYTFALLARDLGFSFWEALPFSGLVAAGFGVGLGFPVLHLRGNYLAIVTLGFGEIIRIVLLNWSPVTGGPNGISDIPRLSFLGLPFARSAPDGATTFAQFFGLEFSLDEPPSTTIARIVADSMNVKLSGLMKPCRVAKKQPPKPPSIAPMPKAESLTFVGLMPRARQATSPSRKASQARPIGSARKRKVNRLATSAKARMTK
jgi:branched-subunit amino acid transport system permease